MSLDEPVETLAEPPLSGAKNQRNPKRRRFRRRWIFVSLLVLFLSALLFLFGPGFRLIAPIAAAKAAASQGLKGSFEIDGNLWSGFSIRNLSYAQIDPDSLPASPEKPTVLSLKLREVSLSYRITDLIRSATELNWLNRIKVDSLDLALQLPEAGEKKDQEKEKRGKNESRRREDYHPVWNLLESEIQIDKISATIQQGEQSFRVSGFGLESLPGTDGMLSVQSVTLPDNDPVNDITVQLQKREHALSIGPIVIAPVGQIRSITIAEPSPTIFTFGLEALVAGGEIEMGFTSDQNLEASLREGTAIDLAKLFAERKEKLPLEGFIKTLDFRFLRPLEAPSRWDIRGTMEGEGLGWDGMAVNTTLLTIRENKLSVNLKRPDALVQLEASLPLENAATTEEIQSLPIDLASTVSVPDLAVLLTSLEKDLPLTGSIALQARDFQVDMTGNVNSGNLLLQGDRISWDGLGIPTLQVAAIVEKPNQLKLAANTSVDSKTTLRATGTFDRTAMAYQGEAQAKFESGGSLSRWLESTKDVVLAGAGSLQWQGSGQLESKEHLGESTVAIRDLKIGEIEPIAADISLEYERNQFTLSQFQLGAGQLSLAGTAGWDGKRIELRDWILRDDSPGIAREVLTLGASVPFDPAVEGGFLEQPDELGLNLKISQLEPASLLGLLQEEPAVRGLLNGQLTASGPFRELVSRADFTFSPELESVGGESQVDVNFEFAGDVPTPRTWNTKIDAEVSGLKWKDVELGLVDLDLHTDDGTTGNRLIGDLQFAHAGTTLDSDLEMDLSGAETLYALAGIPIDFDALLHVESIGSLLRDFAPPNVAGFPADGALDAELRGFRLQDKSLTSGVAKIESETLEVSGQQFQKILINAEVDDPDHLIADLAIALDEKSQTAGAGQFHLREQDYAGELTLEADLKGQGKLRNLLSGRNIAKLLPGTTSLDWEGEGNLKKKQHRGELDLSAETLSLADGAEPIDLKIAGTYSEDSADFPNFELRSDVLDLDGGILWKEDLLSLSGWKGTSSGKRVLSFDASVPLPADSLGVQWFDQKEPLALTLDISDLSVATISRLFLDKAPVQAALNVDLTATGAPSAPSFSGALGLTSIVLPNEKGDIPLGMMALQMSVANDKANIDGRYQHPDLNPFTIQAAMPFFPADWARGQRKVVEESLTLTAKMEKSSLAFLASQIPAIESIDGQVGINAALKGSISKPSISGDGILEVTRLRLDNRDAPSFYDIDLSTRFADNRLTIDRLHAIVAGGVVDGSGSVLLAPGKEPKLDFRVTGDEVLLFRTPDLSLRTDVDIALRGPFSEARLAGRIGITNSRFFKNFDLLPTALPTRNTSVLPTVDRGPSGGGAAYQDLDFGVKVEPFRNWTSDIRVYTKDPFLVRSNLAETDLVADIRVGGTLGRPVPVGFLALNEGELSLPFSSINVETGRITFDETTGFNGALEFKAQAKADKYKINVFLYNRVLDPKYTLTSVPPMPSEDLISLIVTGTARQDLVGDGVGGMAAGKAATLLFKNMRKASAEADKEHSLLDDLQERTELDIGGVNPETGAQTVGGKIRLWKQLFFVGDVDARNDYRAVLKYVFRFR
ncbi:MAG: translocation/assembly module TamB domain-containing protein [Verrucomicrobiales bacterium]|nr:translocation/assembly module TamB domain-containing protein [Verrucomicrobiales bacterium]